MHAKNPILKIVVAYSNMNILIEAIIVGFTTLLIGAIIYRIPSKKTKNVYYLLFLTGYATHFIYEWVGANENYCIYRLFKNLKY